VFVSQGDESLSIVLSLEDERKCHVWKDSSETGSAVTGKLRIQNAGRGQYSDT
jgi:hypothetical protein